MGGRIRKFKIVRIALCWLKAFKWCLYYSNESGSFRNFESSGAIKAWILRQAHTVEKGLALPSPRPFFAKPKIVHLRENLGKSALIESNSEERDIGYGVLSSYVDWHRDINKVNEVIEDISLEVRANAGDKSNGGVIPFSLDVNDHDRKTYDGIACGRRSVRNFDEKIVPLEIVHAAINVANYSPSVCNRQPWAVHVSQGKDKVAKMLKLQAGNKGFSETVTNLAVVLADMSSFNEEYELFEPFVDAGIFSGALVNALASRNVGSCCLNLCVSHNKAVEIIAAMGIPKNYYPVMMVAFGYVAEGAVVAQSKRVTPSVFVS